MIDEGRHSVLGVMVSAVDYEYAVARIIQAAKEGEAFGVTALAVHGVMTGFDDHVHRGRLNALDMVTPDGQPVRWALRWLHGVNLQDRVYGPELTLRLLAEAARQGLSPYFYGSREETLRSLVAHLQRSLPGLKVAGYESSKFRRVTSEEREATVRRILASGASMVFVGLGCPRQEVWTFENVRDLGMPVIAVGAAFDFLGGVLPQAPAALQKRGLEWAFRLASEPKRLWRRYLVLSPRFLWNILLHKLRIRVAETVELKGTVASENFG